MSRELNNVCVSSELNNVCVSSELNNVCVSSELNNFCVSRGLKAQKYLAQGKRSGALGGECNVTTPCKGKSLRLLYTFALTGRAHRSHAKPRASEAAPWVVSAM